MWAGHVNFVLSFIVLSISEVALDSFAVEFWGRPDKGPVIIYVGGGGGGVGGKKSWGGSGLLFLEKRGGPKENFTMAGGGSLCVLYRMTPTSIHVEDLNKF